MEQDMEGKPEPKSQKQNQNKEKSKNASFAMAQQKGCQKGFGCAKNAKKNSLLILTFYPKKNKFKYTHFN